MALASSSGPGEAERPGTLTVWLLPLVSLALNWPYLSAGFVADDVILLNLIREGSAPPWWRGLWAETNLPCLTSLWWSGPLAEGGFWRPLPSVLLQASFALIGEHAWPLHLLAILLHGAIGVLIALLTRRLAGSAGLGLLAGLVFVACEDHSMVVGWVTTITDVLSAFFVAVALLAHQHWLERRRPAMLAVVLVALALALASKESSVVAPFGLAGLTMVCHARAAGTSAQVSHWLRKAFEDRVAWVPALMVLIAYLAAYRALGFGVGGSLLYADPLAEPLTFLGQLVGQTPVLWLATLTPVPPSLAVFVPWTQPALAALGACLFGVFLFVARPLAKASVAVWALSFYVLALLPQTAAEGSERALYLAMVPGSLLLALVAAQARILAPRLLAGHSRASVGTRLAAWWILGGVLLSGALLSAAYAFLYRTSFELPRRQAQSLVALAETRQADHIVILNTSGPFVTLYLGDEVSWRLRRRVDTRLLSSLNGILSVERTGERSLTLSTDRRGWLTNLFALVSRTSGRLDIGQSFPTDLFTATIVETIPGDRRPDARVVRFDLAWPPGDPRVLVVAWDGRRFVEFELAALPVGERRVLADTSDVWASMM